MEFKEIVKNRRSIRQYQSMPFARRPSRSCSRSSASPSRRSTSSPGRSRWSADQETKDKLFAATFGMNQVKDCSHLLVLCADTDYPAHHRPAERGPAGGRSARGDARAHVRHGHPDRPSGMTPEQQAAVVAGAGLHRPGQRRERRLLARSGRLPHDRLRSG